MLFNKAWPAFVLYDPRHMLQDGQSGHEYLCGDSSAEILCIHTIPRGAVPGQAGQSCLFGPSTDGCDVLHVHRIQSSTKWKSCRLLSGRHIRCHPTQATSRISTRGRSPPSHASLCVTLCVELCIYSNTSISGTVSVPWIAFLLDKSSSYRDDFLWSWVFVPQKVILLDESSPCRVLPYRGLTVYDSGKCESKARRAQTCVASYKMFYSVKVTRRWESVHVFQIWIDSHLEGCRGLSASVVVHRAWSGHELVNGIFPSEAVQVWQDLDEIWESEASSWEGACAQFDTEETVSKETTVQLNPQQMRLVSRYFDKVSFRALCRPWQIF